jgi:hypothetical protein
MTPRLLLSAFSRVVAGKAMTETALPSTSIGADIDDAWNAELGRVDKDFDDKERSNVPIDGAELAEGLGSALSFVGTLDVVTRTERERVLTCVRSPGHELTVMYLTSVHHASVGASLARAAELALTTKVVIVREKRFDFPRTWGSVQERRAAFERLPNARWLWLERQDAMLWLALARLLSQARAKRLRHLPTDEARGLEAVREQLLRTLAPHEWPSAASITRWLSDVPRERPSVPPPVSAAAKKVAPPAESQRVPPTLRQWLQDGRAVGRALAGRYVKRLRTFGRR